MMGDPYLEWAVCLSSIAEIFWMGLAVAAYFFIIYVLCKDGEEMEKRKETDALKHRDLIT